MNAIPIQLSKVAPVRALFFTVCNLMDAISTIAKKCTPIYCYTYLNNNHIHTQKAVVEKKLRILMNTYQYHIVLLSSFIWGSSNFVILFKYYRHPMCLSFSAGKIEVLAQFFFSLLRYDIHIYLRQTIFTLLISVYYNFFR